MEGELTFTEFMRGMGSAPWEPQICEDCGGNGLKPVMCCDGRECGCMGMPVDFEPCGCGISPPSDEQIKEWAENWKSNN